MSVPFALLLSLLSSLFLCLYVAEIHGVVYDENGHVPLAGITIFANDRGTQMTTTDAQGGFTVLVPAGHDAVDMVAGAKT